MDHPLLSGTTVDYVYAEYDYSVVTRYYTTNYVEAPGIVVEPKKEVIILPMLVGDRYLDF